MSWTTCDGCLSRDDVVAIDTELGDLWLCRDCREGMGDLIEARKSQPRV